VERNIPDDGAKLPHRGQERQAMPREIPQPPQRWHQQIEMDSVRIIAVGGSSFEAWEPMGAHIQADQREVGLL